MLALTQGILNVCVESCPVARINQNEAEESLGFMHEIERDGILFIYLRWQCIGTINVPFINDT